MVRKEWKINNTGSTKSLIKRLLLVRGIKNETEINEFLNPLELTLLHPNAFCDMQKSVDRIEKAIKEEEKILIYGDFDADGVTSTSVLVKTLKHLGANVDYYIPNRENDGHGLNSNALVNLMVSVKPKLIITVDCGISNIDEVKFINSFKIDVIITDHHEAGEVLPEAYAIINPKAPYSLDEKLSAKDINYMTSLAGVGVAFKLAQGILERFEKLEFSSEILPFVAVGTIADIVPLIGENRYYVLKGLDLIAKGKHYGIKRILENAGYTNIEEGITSEQIAFGVAPRINASGRLDTVREAVTVMISDNKQEVELAVMALENYNKIRQELCTEIFEQADKMAAKDRNNVLILFHEGWHIGIIGIVASKLVEKYGKPTFLMTYQEDTKQYRCSARGVEGCEDLSLHEMISNISDKLDGFGGHTLAAGLYFSEEKSSFEEVKKALIDSYNSLTNSAKLTPVLNIDLEVEPSEVTEDLIQDISKLEPFGASNPSPTFAIKDFKLQEKKLMGSNKEHLKLIVEKDGKVFNAIWWSYGDIALKKGDTLDIAFSPQLNTFNGNTSIQLIIKDVHSDCIVEQEESKVITYDNRKKTDILDKVNGYLKTAKFDFCVFAEKNSIKESLKPFGEIFKRIVDRHSLHKTDGIMFFDYPPNAEIMQDIMDKVEPVRIHFMNYDLEKEQNFDYLKTMAGMIKYVCNSKDGKFDLNSSACFLGLTNVMIELMLEMFEDCGGINILERNEDYFVLSYIKPLDIETMKQSDNYAEFNSMLNRVFTTREEYLTEDLSEICR
ncbi:MAG: single-stranded-DNA-specific exonuclease RecJ [Cyanobacteria bacterium RUI128]|nr:single-stranded-DNA-specific exonuclease RecJ [Cyanobacteria bacterium RUI128]